MNGALDETERPRVAAVVVTHGRPEELRLVVAALCSQSRRPDRIIVFDNASPVPAAAVLGGCEGALEVVRSDTNLGGAGGFAAGLRLAVDRGADWAWLMDDDAVPEPAALASLLAELADLPERSAVLCSAVREYGALALQHRRTFGRWLGMERPLGVASYRARRVGIDTGSFVGFLVAAAAVAEVGLPDAEFFLAYDDTEYSLRLRAAGWRLWLVPGSVIEHLRTAGARLRSSPFGAKHYFNIRNRIAVKQRYARLGGVAALAGMAFGVLLWLGARGPKNAASLQVLWRALADGLRMRLGPYPRDLA
jgi:rhamnopyranosyl-N-acetylglucosaminyl-diphospho-decaprenol beta-1,3/1,4-galactofuranosyltransferase